MKRVCVLSYSGINDSRARRTVLSMSKNSIIDYFYICEKNDIEPQTFNNNVNLFPIAPTAKNRILKKVYEHSFFYLTTSFFIKEVLQNSKVKYDVIYAHDLITSYPAYKLAKLFNAKILYDVHDLYIETINQFFPKKSTGPKYFVFMCLIKSMRFIGIKWQSFFIKKTELIVTTNNNYKNYLENKYGAKNCIITPNYPELKHIEYSNILYDNVKLNKEKQNIILYHGALNDGRYLEQIVESSAFFSKENFLVIIGEGPLKDKLIKLSKSLGNSKVIFLSFVPYEKLLDYISCATIGLILIENINLSKKYALANKVTEYMAAGVALLASDSPENVRIISKANCGHTKTFKSPNELGNFINKITSDNIKLKEMSQNGNRAYRNEFNWDKYEPFFFKSYNELFS